MICRRRQDFLAVCNGSRQRRSYSGHMLCWSRAETLGHHPQWSEPGNRNLRSHSRVGRLFLLLELPRFFHIWLECHAAVGQSLSIRIFYCTVQMVVVEGRHNLPWVFSHRCAQRLRIKLRIRIMLPETNKVAKAMHRCFIHSQCQLNITPTNSVMLPFLIAEEDSGESDLI